MRLNLFAPVVITLVALATPILSQPVEQVPAVNVLARSQNVLTRPKPLYATLTEYVQSMTEIIGELQLSFNAGQKSAPEPDIQSSAKLLIHFALLVKDATVALRAGTTKIDNYENIVSALKIWSEATIPLVKAIQSNKVSPDEISSGGHVERADFIVPLPVSPRIELVSPKQSSNNLSLLSSCKC
jgi:hypothetical protein